ncbi:MAG: hypothetical protein ACRCT8_00010 [Lacipirellulaceae bacterium]
MNLPIDATMLVGSLLSGLEDALSRTEDTSTATVVVLVGVGIGFVVIVVWAFRGAAVRPPKARPGLLFDELAQAHRLRGRDRRLLRRLSSAVGLRHAAEVFVRPDAWEDPRAAETLADNVTARELRPRLYDPGEADGHRRDEGAA